MNIRNASIGRWHGVDPLAEAFIVHFPSSRDRLPYNYGVNNPIMMVDPDGRASECAMCGGNISGYRNGEEQGAYMSQLVEENQRKQAWRQKAMEASEYGIKRYENGKLIAKYVHGYNHNIISYLNTIVSNMDADFDQLWKDSWGNLDENGNPVEYGGFINRQYQLIGKTKGYHGLIYLPYQGYQSLADKLSILGYIHTHPYSKEKEGTSFHGAAFSHNDINAFLHNPYWSIYLGQVSFVEAGNRRFALVITDSDKAKRFIANNSPEKIELNYLTTFTDDYFTNNVGFQQAVSNAVRAAIGKEEDSGIGFYRTDDTEKVSFIQTN